MPRFNFGKGFDDSTLVADINTTTSSSSEYNFGNLHDEAHAKIKCRRNHPWALRWKRGKLTEI